MLKMTNVILRPAIGLALMLGVTSAATAEPAGKARYTAVVDAGSSGTRLHLYRVKPGPYPTVKEIAFFDNNAAGGIGYFINNVGGACHCLGPDAVGDVVFKPLLASAKTELAERGVKPSEVTVDVFGTAGMRSVEKPTGTHSHKQVQAYYESIRTYIDGRGFVAGAARTTDGNSEEGVWTWVDLNNTYRRPFTTKTAPVGVVEVGGSSMQVSYPTAKAVNPSENVYAVTVNGKTFNVFSRSFLGLGQDDARKEMRTENPPANGGASCFPTGMTPAEDVGDLIGDELVKITTTATYSATACGRIYTGIVKDLLTATGNPQVARSTGPFYGVSALRYTLEGIGVSPNAPSPRALRDVLAEKCAPADAVDNFDMSNKYDQRACSSTTYMEALLYGPGGLFHKRPGLFKKAVADSKETKDGKVVTLVNWTRGYLLLKYSR